MHIRESRKHEMDSKLLFFQETTLEGSAEALKRMTRNMFDEMGITKKPYSVSTDNCSVMKKLLREYMQTQVFLKTIRRTCSSSKYPFTAKNTLGGLCGSSVTTLRQEWFSRNRRLYTLKERFPKISKHSSPGP